MLNFKTIHSFSRLLNIQPIPETDKPVSTVFTAGQYSKEDVSKLLGRVTIPDIKPEIREIKPFETTSTELKPKDKQSLSLSSVNKVREFKVPGVGSAHHMSLDKTDRVWISDWIGNLVHSDLQGNQLKKIQTSGRLEGYHTVTQDGDLIYTDKDVKVINKTTPYNYKTTRFIETGDWTPISIHSSRINGDILVGIKKSGEAKVTRYNKTGEEIQNIQRDKDGQELYRNPNYITENINGDICTSDYDKEAVVVVNKSGQHRFSYTGPWSKFCPCGICTDILGYILVSDSISNAFHILDQDGQFLCVLLTEKQGVKRPRGVCVDEENKLYVGQGLINEVTVYEYLQ
eukprot:XP_019928848.1 PREDICTED: uncharacterized protein LOC105343301 [Crassostrea gigas]